jgi:hypothetical protein
MTSSMRLASQVGGGLGELVDVDPLGEGAAVGVAHLGGDDTGWVEPWLDGGRISLGLPSADARPRGTGRNGQGHQVAAVAVDWPFVHVTNDYRDQVGMRWDLRGAAAATCNIAGIAYTGSILSLPQPP